MSFQAYSWIVEIENSSRGELNKLKKKTHVLYYKFAVVNSEPLLLFHNRPPHNKAAFESNTVPNLTEVSQCERGWMLLRTGLLHLIY